MQKRGTRISKDFIIKNVRAENVGNFTLTIAQPPGGQARAYLNTINVTERNMAYGRATYLKIIEQMKSQNIRFTSSEFQSSRDADKVWQWLVNENKARLVNPGDRVQSVDNAGYSTALYEAL
ncbi:MAG: hypothetical protein WA021_04570 [Minisyncoccia bacterium]